MKRMIAFALLMLGFACNALADIPKTINYQGRLLDAANQPVADGEHTVMFRLHTSESELNSIWNEERNIDTQDGYFQVALGEVNSLNPADFRQSLWLGIKMKGEDEMLPRQKLGVVPYAITATQLAAPNSNTQAAVIVDIQGRVGIGKEQPGAKLHIGGSPGVDGISFPDGSLQKRGIRIYRNQVQANTLTNGSALPGAVTFYAEAGQKTTLELSCTGRANASGHTYIHTYLDGVKINETGEYSGAGWIENIQSTTNVTISSGGNHTFSAMIEIGSGATSFSDNTGEQPLGGITWTVTVGGDD